MLTKKLAEQFGINMLLDQRKNPSVTKVHGGPNGWLLDYGNALRITIAHDGVNISVRLVPIPHKCNSNFIEAARQDLNAALLKATKQVFGITTF
jgi:hypothetical protein